MYKILIIPIKHLEQYLVSGKFIALNAYPQKKMLKINDLKFHLKMLEKEEQK